MTDNGIFTRDASMMPRNFMRLSQQYDKCFTIQAIAYERLTCINIPHFHRNKREKEASSSNFLSQVAYGHRLYDFKNLRSQEFAAVRISRYIPSYGYKRPDKLAVCHLPSAI